MAEVIQLKNPRALLAPEIEKILRAATASDAFVAPVGFDSVAADIFEMVTNENSFILVGFEEGEAKAVTWGFFPASRMFPYPTITMFYSVGSKALLGLMRERLLDVLLERGYTKAWAVNITGKSNAAWQKVFTVPGKTKIEVLGSVMQLSLI